MFFNPSDINKKIEVLLTYLADQVMFLENINDRLKEINDNLTASLAKANTNETIEAKPGLTESENDSE